MMAKKKVQDQGERILRIEAYIRYASMTKDEAQRRDWTFYEAIIFEVIGFRLLNRYHKDWFMSIYLP